MPLFLNIIHVQLARLKWDKVFVATAKKTSGCGTLSTETLS